ncbi:MAG: helicase-related protein [archaeon]
MKKTVNIPKKYSDAVINIALDTISLNKQALVFVNTKRGAESQAEKISSKIKEQKEEWTELSEKALKALSKPTKQCKRLALCLNRGIAFHHAGLASKQRELIEENFREGKVKIICCTPTLAYGLNLPSFRTIVRDLKRYGGPWGMHPIPILEYHQMIGRSGRPDFNDEYGEAICIAGSKGEKEKIIEHYLEGDPEEIYSKLAVEPVLRTYILSLIATEFVTSEEDLKEFFDNTFYAHQFKDLSKLHGTINRMLKLLEEWDFIRRESSDKDFMSADELGKGFLKATLIGHRVAELYLDPATAFFIITCLRRATQKILSEFSFLQMVSSCNEMRPLLSMRVADYDVVTEKALKYHDSVLELEPSEFSEEYEDYMKSIKTAMFFQDWINEMDEEYLLETYNIRPGETRVKLNLADWLLYSSEELAKLLKFHPLIKELIKMRFRLKHGAKEELLPLLKLRDIGRVRARMMFKNGIRDITGVKKVEYTLLAHLLGKKVALSVKKQVGQDLTPEKVVVKTKKRKGQKNIKDF